MNNHKSKRNFISIVIPTKDRCELLLQVLPSYLNQKHIREIIIVNDGSSDDTEKNIKQLMKKNKKIHYHTNIINKGTPASKNIGSKIAKGDYVFVGEDDLELEKGYLKKLYCHLMKTNADIIAGRLIDLQIGETHLEAKNRVNRVKGNIINYKLLTTNFQIKVPHDTILPLLGSSMLINRKVFNEIQYDENLKGNFWREETDFQIAAAEKGYRLIHCPHVLSFHLTKIDDKGGSHSSSRFIYILWCIKNTYYFINKHEKYLRMNLKLNNKIVYITNFSLYSLIYILTFGWIVRQKKKVLNYRIRSQIS